MRTMRWCTAILALALPLVAVPVSGSTPGPQDPKEQKPVRLCFKCRGTGKIPLEIPSIETGVLHCSHFYRANPGNAAGFVPCERCDFPEVRFEYEDKRAIAEKWLEKCVEYEKAAEIDRGVLIETEHTRLFFALPSITFEKKRMDMHRGAHDYAALLEKVYREYCRIFGIENESPFPKHEIFVLDDEAMFSRFLFRYRGTSGMHIAGMKFRGDVIWFITWRDPVATDRDELLREKVVHNFGHLLIFKYRNRTLDLPTWLDTGFANYLEHLIFQDNRNNCFIEVPPPGQFKEGSLWKARLKKEALVKENLAFADFYDKDLNAYDYRDMAYAYSYVDFFIEYDIEKFRALVDRIKQGTKTLDAVREIYGWLPPELTEAWRGYVTKRY